MCNCLVVARNSHSDVLVFIIVAMLAQVSAPMKRATLLEIRTVSLDGLKPHWKICKPEDVTMVDGTAFVRVAPSNYSLNGLISASQEGTMAATLQNSKGLANLIKMRNMAQAAYLSGSADDTHSNLFDAAPRRKKARVPRHQLEALRKAPQSITLHMAIDDETHEVEVLRPVHSTDNLFIAYDDVMVGAVLHYIRNNGFSEPASRHRADLPKGIHIRKNCFIVKYTKPCGSSGYRSEKTLDSALAFHADHISHMAREDDVVAEDNGDVSAEEDDHEDEAVGMEGGDAVDGAHNVANNEADEAE
jgi:hypothetical protein